MPDNLLIYQKRKLSMPYLQSTDKTFGFDIDNTLINYSQSLTRLARLDPRLYPLKDFRKQNVKRFLIENYGEESWTEIQASLYTEYVQYSKISPIAVRLLSNLSLNNKVLLLSHKSKHPIKGVKKDMRLPVLEKLLSSGLDVTKRDSRIQVQFFETKTEKIEAIHELNLDFFLDDLLDILLALRKKETLLGWFCDSDTSEDIWNIIQFRDWREVSSFVYKRF